MLERYKYKPNKLGDAAMPRFDIANKQPYALLRATTVHSTRRQFPTPNLTHRIPRPPRRMNVVQRASRAIPYIRRVSRFRFDDVTYAVF